MPIIHMQYINSSRIRLIYNLKSIFIMIMSDYFTTEQLYNIINHIAYKTYWVGRKKHICLKLFVAFVHYPTNN